MAYKWTNNAIATATSVASEDLILTVDDPSGTPMSKKITVANLIGSTDVISVIESNTNVTLAGSYDYLTISGQVITLGQIDLSTDVTGTLASGNIGSHTHVIADVTDFTDSSTNWNTAYGWGDHGTEGYLTSYTETDPIFVASDVYSVTTADIGTWTTAYGWGDHGVEGYLTSYTETDPVFIASDVYGVTTADIANWDEAYGWGDHSSGGYLTSFTETDPIFVASDVYGVTSSDIATWDTAYGWGNHGAVGYLTSYTETDPVFVASDVYGVTTADISTWDTAYGWGDHSTEGYLTSYTESDPVFVASDVYGVTTADIGTWDTAYGWGNHASAGYLTSYTESDPIFVASDVYGVTTADITNWDTAHGWGDHSTEGYLTSIDDALSGKDTDDLAEGTTNQYFTNARARSAISLTTTDSSELSYDSGTGVFSYVSPTTVADANSVTLEVRNTTGSTISKGAAVYISGHSGTKILIDLADSDASGKYPAIGLAAGAISNNSDGEVTVYGELAGIDTSSYSVGDVLYLSSTAGALTSTRPTSSADAVQNIGKVARSDSNGIIIVSGSGRANDIPNLANTYVFIGGASGNEQRALTTADILSGTFANDRISQSSVTQHQAALSITESQISDLQSYITGITGEPLSDLSDATITAVASGEILKWSGSAWINNTLAEADIASAATLSSHAGSTANPHSVTATQVGLGNVENTALSTWSGSSNVTTVGETAVTAHEGALTITESQVSDLGNYVDAGTALVYSIIF